jgi:hypothetical protein
MPNPMLRRLFADYCQSVAGKFPGRWDYSLVVYRFFQLAKRPMSETCVFP